MKKIIIVIFLFLLSGCASLMQNVPGYTDKETRKNYVDSHPGIPNDIKNFIINGKIAQGMTKEQVRATWGKPSNITSSSNGYEIWDYHSNNFLYFNNDTLTNWTQSNY